MKKKQTIIAAVVLMLVLLVGGLIAYFTDTDTETNKFTIGKVKIDLTETDWNTTDTDGDNIPDVAQDLMPNQEVLKNPKIKNDNTGTDKSTSPAYVFIKVEVPCYTTNPAAPATSTAHELFTYTVNTGWTELTSEQVACTSSTQKATHVYYYGSNGTLTELAVGATTSSAVFDKVKLANIDGSETLPSDTNIPVTGYGIQKEGIAANDPAAAFANFS